MSSQQDKLNGLMLQAELSPVRNSQWLYDHEVRVVHEVNADEIELESHQYGDNADIFKEGALFVLKSIYGDVS